MDFSQGPPYDRVLARHNGRASRSEREPTGRLLDSKEEKGLYIWLDRLNLLRTRPSKRMLEYECNFILAQRHTDPNTRPPRCGAKWAQHFLARHPEYKLRKDKAREIEREAAEDLQLLIEWFKTFNETVQKFQILPSGLYNFDESPIRLGQANDAQTIALASDLEVRSGKNTSRESFTLGECISADGHSIDPLVILKGIQHLAGWYRTNLPDSYLIALSETAYINDDISLAWIKHFHESTHRRQVGVWRMLLFDGHTTHITKELITFADEKNIILFLCPPHLTQLIQPLDVAVFSVYKHYYGEAVTESYATGCDDFTKLEFLDRLHHIRMQTLKARTIKSGWERAGLVPFDPEVVLAPLRCRVEPSTPEHSDADDTDLPTPTTSRRHKILAKTVWKMWKRLPETNQHDKFEYLLAKLLRSSSGIAHSNTSLQRTLQANTAATQRRESLKKNYRGVLQTGGILKVKDRRQIVRDREQKGLEEERLRAEREHKRACEEAMKQWRDEIKQGLFDRGAQWQGKKGLHEFINPQTLRVAW